MRPSDSRRSPGIRRRSRSRSRSGADAKEVRRHESRRSRSRSRDGGRPRRSRHAPEHNSRTSRAQMKRRSRSPSRPSSPDRAEPSRRYKAHRQRSPGGRRGEASGHRRPRREYSTSPPSKRRRSTPRSRSRSRSPVPPSKRRRRSPSYSESPPPRSRRRSSPVSPSRSRSRPRSTSPRRRRGKQSPPLRSRQALPSQEASFRGGNKDSATALAAPAAPAGPKQTPNYAPTGLLAAETNTVAGTRIVLKYHEPAGARKPPASQQWRIFVFDGPEAKDTLHLYTASCWLLGREAAVADYRVPHRSVSGQHAAVQFRFRPRDGSVRPYLIDLESRHGTLLNGEKVEAGRFLELKNGDVVRLGGCKWEFVVVLPEEEEVEVEGKD